MQDVEGLIKIMAFCPAMVVYGEKKDKILCTQCWEWLEENEDKFNGKNVKSKTSDGIMNVWDLEKKKFVDLENDKIRGFAMYPYKGITYLK